MKKWMVLLLLCAMMCTSACAQGVTLRTFTPFADMDFAAQAYEDLLGQWEAQTGCTVEDYSGAMDESWMVQLREMAAAGQADIVIVPLGSGLTADELVTAQELAAAAPQLGVKVFSSMAEADGSILLAPLRLNWEALYVNTTILKDNGLSVPVSLEELVVVCSQLSAKGILPVANALFDWSEIVLDCAALCGAPKAAYGSAESFGGARDVAAMLAAVGAFGSDPAALDDAAAMELFLSGEAAMRFDSDFLAYDISPELADAVTVIAPPMRGGEKTGMIVGTPAYGAALTRACFADDARREAALSLLEALFESEGLLSPAGGMLGAGIMQLTRAADDCTGLLYDADPDGFDAWSAGVVQGLGR